MSESKRIPLALLAMLAACAGDGGAAEEKGTDKKPEATPSADLEARLEARRQLGRIPGESVPVEREPAPTGEVPEAIMAELLADASARSGVAAADIAVLRAESLTFPDGSLGCPKPDVVYTQAPVPGCRVVLDAGGEEYDYRVPEGGRFVLCDGHGPGGLSPPTATVR